jgi:hypothetical protein
MACKYHIKFVGTNDTSSTFAGIVGATSALTLGVYAVEPKEILEGDGREFLSGVSESSRTTRVAFEIEFFPFSTFRPIDENYPQNTNTILALRSLFTTYKYVWLCVPDAPKVPPPRWNGATDYSTVTALLPRRIVRTSEIDSSLNKEQGHEEITATFNSREI